MISVVQSKFSLISLIFFYQHHDSGPAETSNGFDASESYIEAATARNIRSPYRHVAAAKGRDIDGPSAVNGPANAVFDESSPVNGARIGNGSFGAVRVHRESHQSK